jgi:pimeloyl-ACP methyl ester carboxylesterase
LQERYRIAALDLPGFGFSALERNRTYCTLQEHLEALGIFADAVGHTPVILLGHSFGGWIGAFHASRHPHRVRHLVLVDTAGIYYRGAEKLRESFTLNSVQDTRRLLNDLWLRYPWYFKPFAGAIFRELRQRGLNELVASIDAESFLVEELGRFSMPVSIIWGREDRVILPESVNILMKFIPHARVSLIDHCGHVPQLERPAEFAALVRGILKDDDGLA